MRTNVLSAATGSAWLELDVKGKEPERIELDALPFTLGRNESCDYQVRSTRVSREHCEIYREGGSLRIRDLKSTNGTLVNGERITERRLVDGDLIVVADVTFSFRSGDAANTRRTVTQVMDGGDEPRSRECDPAAELIHAVRRRQEMLLHRALPCQFQPIYDLAENRCLGYEALPQMAIAGESSAVQQVLDSVDCRLTERLRELQRRLAAEHVARLPDVAYLFVNLQPAEVGADHLPESLQRLARVAGKKIVAEIPDSAVVDIPYFREFRARLAELDVGVAYDGFAGSQHQMKAQAEFAADFVKLAPALVRGIDKSTQRQQQVKAVIELAQQMNVQLIAVGVHNDNEARTCRELGCRLAQGDHFTSPSRTG
jgi:EAL domain-containing protein (putative c-di-GMP-specific phosphodiesterase class I)